LLLDLTAGYVELVAGDADAAAGHLATARTAVEEFGAEGALAGVLLGEAGLLALRGSQPDALATWREADALRQTLGLEWSPEERAVIERVLEPLGVA
jgi:hypothetical protein